MALLGLLWAVGLGGRLALSRSLESGTTAQERHGHLPIFPLVADTKSSLTHLAQQVVIMQFKYLPTQAFRLAITPVQTGRNTGRSPSLPETWRLDRLGLPHPIPNASRHWMVSHSHSHHRPSRFQRLQVWPLNSRQTASLQFSPEFPGPQHQSLDLAPAQYLETQLYLVDVRILALVPLPQAVPVGETAHPQRHGQVGFPKAVLTPP